MKSETYKIKDSRLFRRFVTQRDLAEDTARKYIVCLNRYINFHDMTLEELVDEALEDDRTKFPIDRAIYDRMIDFRTFMLDEGYSSNTINTTMGVVKTFYKQFRVEVPSIPTYKRKKSPNDLITLNDLPDLDDIRIAIENTRSIKRKAMILFSATNGTARKEISEFTFGQFLEGIQEFCPNVETPNDIIRELDGRCEEKQVIPIFRMYRFKTDEYYFTITTPECVQFIINYLKHEARDLKPEDKLFKMTENGVSAMYQQINNRMDWGQRGNINFFSSHRIRKFNASAIANEDLANTIQGRKPTKIKATYYKDNPKLIREDYINHMHKFNIYVNYDVMLNSEAYDQLKKELEKEREKNKQYERELDTLRNSNTSIQTQMVSMQEQIDNINHLNDITRIQDYIADNDLVKEYGLASRIIDLYKEDMKKGVVSVDNSYIDTLITRSYNRSIYDGENEFITIEKEPIERDELYNKLEYELYSLHDSIINGTNIKLSDAQDKKISKILDDYLIKTWKANGKIDQGYIGKIIEDIVLNG